MQFSLTNLTVTQRRWRQRLLTVSFEQKLSHLGSCLSSLDIIGAVYSVKKPHDSFVLSNGHAAFAWYVILEDHKLLKSDITTLSVHPTRVECPAISVSTGSLGHGLPIAVGMALANPRQTIYCLVSDGECYEGSIWEAVKVITEHNVKNLQLLVNANGWAAYQATNSERLKKQFNGFGMKVKTCQGHDWRSLIRQLKLAKPSQSNSIRPVLFCQTTVEQLPFLHGQSAHYHVMSAADYATATTLLLPKGVV